VNKEVFVKETHRGLWYENGVLQRELEVLAELSKTATARIYIGFDKHVRPGEGDGS